GTWGFALLQQSQQIEKGRSGEWCAEAGDGLPGEAGGRDRDAQAHEVAVGHDDMTGTLGRMTDRHDGEASSEQRMRRIGYLDLVRGRLWWVLERGIMLLGRSTTWIMATCGRFSGFGCVTVCCCD